jgi:hypothetical protein
MTVGATEQRARCSLRVEEIAIRRCRGCSHEWPGYLRSCRSCAAALGDPFARRITIVTPPVARGSPTGGIRPAAVLALELSTELAPGDRLLPEAKELIAPLDRAEARRRLPSGVVVALFGGSSLAEAASQAALAAARVAEGQLLEIRRGIALGLVDGRAWWRGAVVADAERLARAAQPGQTLATYAANRALATEWSFGPVGVLPRREEDTADAAAFLGRKRPAATPSALAPDEGQPLVGRRAELASLERELARARAGEARWCAVVAPAGGGKSKLLRTLLARVDRGSLRLAGAAASPFGAAPLSLCADLCSALGNPLADEASPERALLQLSEALAPDPAGRPTLVVVDDLHWADEASRRVLRELSGRRLSRCLFVVALRSSFAGSVPWLHERATTVELPGLAAAEREQLVERLLPGRSHAPLRRELTSAPAAANPLYLEHAAAFVRESRADELPRSLHEAVLQRLDLLRQTLHPRGSRPPSADDLAEAERKIGEWLDRLETGDYESRAAIAGYLALLENIDLDLVVAGSIAGRPVERNRRLAAVIERFYSASFAERVEAIERLAEDNRAGASYAAERGADHALASLRLADARAYLELASRHSEGSERTRRLLLSLGDARLATGDARGAWRAYGEARRAGRPERHGRVERRLARAAIALGRLGAAEALLERARPGPSEEASAIACDLAVVRVLLGRRTALRALQEAESLAASPADGRLLLRSHLRVGLATGRNVRALAAECATSLSLPADPLAEQAELVETVALVRRVLPGRVGPALVDEAERAARRLGNPAALDKVRVAEPGWRPIHASV